MNATKLLKSQLQKLEIWGGPWPLWPPWLRLCTSAIFLDIKKAFDSIDRQILLKKLNNYGFRSKFWNILKSYLENRKMLAILDKNKSKLSKITHGKPQDSVLDFLLFLLHIKDLPLASKFKSTLFADDAIISSKLENITSTSSS